MFGIVFTAGRMQFVTAEDLGYPETESPIEIGHTVSRISTPWTAKNYCEEIRKGLEWTKKHGAEARSDGRHMHYLCTIESNMESIDSRSGAHEVSREVNMAMYETHELSRIRKNFQGTNIAGLTNKLREYVRGPAYYMDEQPGDETGNARNYGLELAIGGEMQMIGLPVSYGAADYPEPMVHTPVGDYAMQCKRISSHSEHAIQRNLRKAAKQIRKNIELNTKIRAGIAVIDVTKKVNPDGSRRVREDILDEESPIRKHMFKIRDRESEKFDFAAYPEVEALIFRATYPRTASGDLRNDEWICRTMSWIRPEDGPFCDLVTEKHRQLRIRRNEEWQREAEEQGENKTGV